MQSPEPGQNNNTAVSTTESLLCFNIFKPFQQTYKWVVVFPFPRWENWHPNNSNNLPKVTLQWVRNRSKPRLSGSRVQRQIASSGRKRRHFLLLIFFKGKKQGILEAFTFNLQLHSSTQYQNIFHKYLNRQADFSRLTGVLFHRFCKWSKEDLMSHTEHWKIMVYCGQTHEMETDSELRGMGLKPLRYFYKTKWLHLPAFIFNWPVGCS